MNAEITNSSVDCHTSMPAIRCGTKMKCSVDFHLPHAP